MSDTKQDQPLQIGAISAATMFELLKFVEEGGTHAYGRLLREKAIAELDVIAKRMTDEKIKIETEAFQRGADEQRRADKLLRETASPIQLKPVDSFLDPNGATAAVLIDVSKGSQDTTEDAVPTGNRAARRAAGRNAA